MKSLANALSPHARPLVLAVLAVVSACGSDAPSSTPAVSAPTTPTSSTPTATTPTSPVGTATGAVAGAPSLAGAAGATSTARPSGGASATPSTPAAAGSGVPGQPVAATAGAAAPVIAGSAGAQAPAMAAAGSGAADPADADIEKCYELRAHGQPVPGDKSKYAVPANETYSGFIFKAPWTTPVQGLRFRHLADNKAVLHHWLLYSESAPFSDGDLEECALDGPTGFLCGQASTRALITGWAPGRGDFRLPKDVGLELPAPGALLAVEFHYFNTSGAPAQDQSGVEVCVTSKFRPNTAAITWLGTQQINVAGRMMGDAAGTCNPLRTGMGASEPIHILYSWPHMHKLGTHMKSVVKRANGMEEMMYDGAFNFEYQILHDTPVLLQAGDSVKTTCTFMNTTDTPVGFGQSTTQEMCYNFVYSWPAHALDNPGAEIGGATNTCLH